MSLLGTFRATLDSLGVRVPALLTVALLPVGLIGVIQTAQVDAVARDREDVTFLSITERAANLQRQVIERAVGVAQGLAQSARVVRGDPATCTEVFAPFLETPYGYAFAGYVDADGTLDCSGSGASYDFSGSPEFEDFVADPRLSITANMTGAISQESVIIVTVPVFDEADAFDGFVSLSVPHRALEDEAAEAIDLVTFNSMGSVLTPPDLELAGRLVPDGMTLSSLPEDGARVFDGRNTSGEDKVYAVVPILPGALYALGSWDRTMTLQSGFGAVPVWTFPILMWLASLAVAYFAVHRLVIRHVRTLLEKMRAFAETRTLPRPSVADLPAELDEIELGLVRLSERIVRDEAETEDRLHEQKVMMKEIHHRVKNNLQLISSLINMQMRQLDSPEARLALGRVRDRVLGLATVHRSLYEAKDVAGIEADKVVRRLSRQLIDVGADPSEVRLELSLAPVTLYPDQAVPLSLFLTEALTNALKYSERADKEPAVIEIDLKTNEDGNVLLAIRNPAPEHAPIDPEQDSPGLGQGLIRAFAAQLDGEVTSQRADGTYRVALAFPPSGFLEAGAAPAA